MPLSIFLPFAVSSVWSPALPASGDGTFRAPLGIGDVPHPVAVAAGDFNRDGKLDLAAVGPDRLVTILLQDPARRTVWKRPEPLRSEIANFYLRAADLEETPSRTSWLANGMHRWSCSSGGPGAARWKRRGGSTSAAGRSRSPWETWTGTGGWTSPP